MRMPKLSETEVQPSNAALQAAQRLLRLHDSSQAFSEDRESLGNEERPPGLGLGAKPDNLKSAGHVKTLEKRLGSRLKGMDNQAGKNTREPVKRAASPESDDDEEGRGSAFRAQKGKSSTKSWTSPTKKQKAKK